MGENPAMSDPDLEHVRAGLARLEHLVVQDIFLTETARQADVVLPAATWGEKTGTFTNADRTVHLSEKAVEPPGEAKSDLDIFLDYARRMDFRDKDGQPLIKWDDPESAFEALVRACASIAAYAIDSGYEVTLVHARAHAAPATLADAGKLASDGYAFINSYNTEMATGGIWEGEPPLETGAIAADYDYLHIIDWHKAEEVVAAGKYVEHNGMRVITLDTAIEEGLLYFAAEPRNPHGVDISPDGNYIVVSGKLDPNTTTYSIERIERAIAAGDIEGYDPYGVPILTFDSVVEAQVEVGGGPLHTQFDGEGNAYTSLFVESAVAKWTLGPEAGVTGYDAWQLLDKIPVHYNIGHLVGAHGDTVNPGSDYLVAMNKWSVDRHAEIGTLHPQNFQLIDVSGDGMRLLKDMPIGFGEPHYAQMISADVIGEHVWTTYPEVGMDTLTMATSPVATTVENARIEENGDVVDVYMAVLRSHFVPDVVRVKEGQTVNFHLSNIETAQDATHGFAIPGYNAQASLDPGETLTVTIEATRSGSFGFYCTEFCSALHLEMQGWLLVEPA
jgi:nitrous-oxide reductase